MPSLFHSETDLYLSFPSLTTVELHSKKEGEGSLVYTATTFALLPNTLHVLDISHKLESPSYRVTEALAGTTKTYTVATLGEGPLKGFTTTMETAGLLNGKHFFQVGYNYAFR